MSDGGGQVGPEPEPKRDWVRHAFRIFELIDNQVRSLRERQVIGSFTHQQRTGAFWGIRTNSAAYGLPDALPCPWPTTMALATTATRLKRLEPNYQERLINWGYAVCDAALRRYYVPALAAPQSFVYPHVGV